MLTVQQIITELEAEKEIALQGFAKKECEDFNSGMHLAISFCIQKLKLLLNTENENGGKKDASNDGKPM